MSIRIGGFNLSADVEQSVVIDLDSYSIPEVRVVTYLDANNFHEVYTSYKIPTAVLSPCILNDNESVYRQWKLSASVVENETPTKVIFSTYDNLEKKKPTFYDDLEVKEYQWFYDVDGVVGPSSSALSASTTINTSEYTYLIPGTYSVKVIARYGLK